MNISELFRLHTWLQQNGKAVQSQYQKLGEILQHNATQPEKQPVSEPLEQLVGTLSKMPLEQLTNEQIGLLRHLGIEHLIGPEGAAHVKRTVIRSDYDPATAAKEIQEDGQAISSALNQMNQVGSALGNLKLPLEIEEEIEGRVTVRVQFKDEASISDVAEWKKWSN